VEAGEEQLAETRQQGRQPGGIGRRQRAAVRERERRERQD